MLSFPPHLVREYLQRFGIGSQHIVLDPFCGTGTTIVECKKLGIPSIGVEAIPWSHFVTTVKIDWTPDPDGLVRHAQEIADLSIEELRSQGIEDNPPVSLSTNDALLCLASSKTLRALSPEKERLLLTNSISPLPLHKTLVLLDCINRNRDECFRNHELLALGKALVFNISNLNFGPEVGVGRMKIDCPVVAPWLALVETMAADLRLLQKIKGGAAVVHNADARRISEILSEPIIDAVVTSPPYPNEKDYTRTTRLESVLLGFAVLRLGAQLAYVVGNQASYLQVMIRTDYLLANIAESLGYNIVGTDLFFTRWATSTKENLREEIVLLQWPGIKKVNT